MGDRYHIKTALVANMLETDVHYALTVCAAWWRDLIRVSMGAATQENPDHIEQLHLVAKRIELSSTFDCLEQADRLKQSLDSGLNVSLQFAALMLQYQAAIDT